MDPLTLLIYGVLSCIVLAAAASLVVAVRLSLSYWRERHKRYPYNSDAWCGALGLSLCGLFLLWLAYAVWTEYHNPEACNYDNAVGDCR